MRKMFLKKKYVLVKQEHEIHMIKKLLVALVILVTVFGTPVLLEYLVRSYHRGKENVGSYNTSINNDCHGCTDSQEHEHINTTLIIDNEDLFDEIQGDINELEDEIEKTKVLLESGWSTINDTATSVIIPTDTEEEDDYYDYSDDGFDSKDKTPVSVSLNPENDEVIDGTPELAETDENPSPVDITDESLSPAEDKIVTPSIDEEKETNLAVEEFFGARKDLHLSRLGDILFKRAEYPPPKDENFKILIWKDGTFLQRRHINYFSGKSHDPFEECSVKNCILSYNMEEITSADAVVFLLLRQTLSTLPDLSQVRPPNQRWIFLSDENPHNTFLDKTSHWSNYSGIFNWSMTYRMESDVPVANARVVPIQMHHSESTNLETVIPNYDIKQRDVLVAVTLTNCSLDNPVTAYIAEMQKYLNVDVYGKCGDLTKACPAHFAKDCPALNKYMFYFSFENAHCKEYMSQKLFWNSFEKGAVPIIAGVPIQDCKTMLPPNSYLHTATFGNAQELATYILQLNNTWDENYWKLQEWRNDFKVVNEHGYFGSKSFHYCRICEALNYNDDEVKIYNDLSNFLNPEDNCSL